jgi:RNA polymerase sigma-70 factor (ECF subfamily)
MSSADSFADFIRRIRAGDMRAAEDLVRRYEPAVRLEVRMRLRDPRLRRVLDSMDVCQSVLATFFTRAAAGEYQLDQPDQLLRLLVTIARNKVAYVARKERAECRDHRRTEPGGLAAREVVAAEPGPSQVAAGKELFQQFRDRLTPEELRLAELRASNVGWAEIAAQLGGTPAARRMQLHRAAERVARQLGLDDTSDE